MALYIFQVILFQSIFLIVYKLWLQRETFFTGNRIYLLGTPLLSFLLPFIKLEVLKNTVNVPPMLQQLPAVFIGDKTHTLQHLPAVTISQAPETLGWGAILVALYILGVVISLYLFIKKYNAVTRFFRFKRKHDHNIITLPNSTEAFTFFNTIFLGEGIDTQSKEQILNHEWVHVKEKHGWDLLMFECLRVAFWFNPIIYLFQHSVSELHEYIADQKASSKTEKSQYYNQLLNTAFGTQDISFINTFFKHSLIKKRIVMLQKQSKSIAKIKYLLVLPVLAAILTYTSCSTDENSLDSKETSLEQQVAMLKATIESKEKLTSEELNLLEGLKEEYRKKIEIIEVTEIEKLPQSQSLDMPFAVIEEVPIFPGCEGMGNQARKKCMSDKITALISSNFNTKLGKQLGLEGVNRIYVRFKIDANGKVTGVETRGPHPVLEEEAKRVVNLLPEMVPGIHEGKRVATLYSLPIIFKVD